ncbi:hypothetical protein FXF51_01910 [Nonomuraea sp. PA05]|uniref:hypothetical protein n=1 Tax=Nonomuraea sp. PA05 TaxID=2604466 RepID=UPI0011DA5ADA|nr:hypothetical protein [Nonomuraea sp. PA05]TYB71216.1 hypothetical protein FXF51_01910 [Nonomuraea sp. PA05]
MRLPYEYGMRSNDADGDPVIVMSTNEAHDRAAADAWCRTRRAWQEEREITPDVTLMRRLPDGEWEEDPGWKSEITTWEAGCARIEAAPTDEARRDARSELDAWVEFKTTARETGQIRVKVRDYSAEAPWGVGLTNPVVRAIVISAYCVVCGCPRGMPRRIHQCDDGVHYWPDVWNNPCGHTDMYEAVIKEAEEFAPAGRITLFGEYDESSGEAG